MPQRLHMLPVLETSSESYVPLRCESHGPSVGACRPTGPKRMLLLRARGVAKARTGRPAHFVSKTMVKLDAKQFTFH